MLGQLSGVASLAGISLGGGDEKAVFHLEEKLKSRDFLIPFLKKHNIKIPLFAAEDWTQSSNTLVYDSSIYDFNNNKWLRDVDYPQLPEPTNEEAYKKFREIFKVSFDRKKRYLSCLSTFIVLKLQSNGYLYSLKSLMNTKESFNY
nr:hypothetical protein [Ningiella sp. W23]